MFNFSSNYGKAVVFSWLDDNKLIIGFSSGTISMVSTKSNALGQELASASIGNVAIESIAVNADLGKIAVASQGTIRFLQLADWQEVQADRIEITKSCGKITKLYWTKDGSIMTVTTSNGYFVGFLTVIPSLFSSYETNVGLLSRLTEVSVIDCIKNNQILAKVALDIEPTFLSMGPNHFCVGINSSITYYRWKQ